MNDFKNCSQIKSGLSVKYWGENVKSRKIPHSGYVSLVVPAVFIVILFLSLFKEIKNWN